MYKYLKSEHNTSISFPKYFIPNLCSLGLLCRELVRRQLPASCSGWGNPSGSQSPLQPHRVSWTRRSRNRRNIAWKHRGWFWRKWPENDVTDFNVVNKTIKLKEWSPDMVSDGNCIQIHVFPRWTIKGYLSIIDSDLTWLNFNLISLQLLTLPK